MLIVSLSVCVCSATPPSPHLCWKISAHSRMLHTLWSGRRPLSLLLPPSAVNWDKEVTWDAVSLSAGRVCSDNLAFYSKSGDSNAHYKTVAVLKSTTCRPRTSFAPHYPPSQITQAYSTWHRVEALHGEHTYIYMYMWIHMNTQDSQRERKTKQHKIWNNFSRKKLHSGRSQPMPRTF